MVETLNLLCLPHKKAVTLRNRKMTCLETGRFLIVITPFQSRRDSKRPELVARLCSCTSGRYWLHLHAMTRRLLSLPRIPVLFYCLTRRAFSKPSLPLPVRARSRVSNAVLELDARKVGCEIRRRGLTSAVGGPPRDGGMDRVSGSLSSLRGSAGF